MRSRQRGEAEVDGVRIPPLSSARLPAFDFHIVSIVTPYEDALPQYCHSGSANFTALQLTVRFQSVRGRGPSSGTTTHPRGTRRWLLQAADAEVEFLRAQVASRTKDKRALQEEVR